jgi:hypothetical protein
MMHLVHSIILINTHRPLEPSKSLSQSQTNANNAQSPNYFSTYCHPFVPFGQYKAFWIGAKETLGG